MHFPLKYGLVASFQRGEYQNRMEKGPLNHHCAQSSRLLKQAVAFPESLLVFPGIGTTAVTERCFLEEAHNFWLKDDRKNDLYGEYMRSSREIYQINEGFYPITKPIVHVTYMAAVEECVVVIDGANVACQKDGNPHIPSLAVAIQYFRSLEAVGGRYHIKCVAFVPNYWLNVKPIPRSAGPQENGAMETEDWTLLNEMVQKGFVILTPSQAHDDLYVIDYAVKYNGFIVTNDMFRDHISSKRTFHGRMLTTSWVRSHCIDFTFVGNDFMPNPRAMEQLLSFQPSILTSLLTTDSSSHDDTNRRNGSSDVNEDGMVIDHAGHKRIRKIDLSEVTYYKVPRKLLPMLHGNGGKTMEKFQEYTGTYLVLPSHAVLEPSTTVNSNVLTLSIYGSCTSDMNSASNQQHKLPPMPLAMTSCSDLNAVLQYMSPELHHSAAKHAQLHLCDCTPSTNQVLSQYISLHLSMLCHARLP
ncbi:hypothetical protein PsorP6_008605 [Peronosclerospora sorghi]|uniref:Uncharacterized protein n=1 Tax=Peronosclerospora sorghi TaxID=230839 RepID=A0ACC0WAC5_9STRA|nr:hypothetical protein PsorP6_008605 [Peronosclerospora sorghi]